MIIRLIKKLYIRRKRINKRIGGRNRYEAKRVFEDDR